jgi:hypothetical protein
MQNRSTQVVRKVIPGKLTLFELALLVDVVHNIAPVYSLFENDSYWFVKIICDSVVALSDGNFTDDDQDSDVNNQPYRPPPNRPLSLHSSLSGPWNGVLVSNVRDRVLVAVLSNFLERRDEEMAKVHFPQSSVTSYHSQNLLKIQRREQTDLEALYHEEKMQRTAINREEEIQALQSDMTNLQAEMVDLLNTLHKVDMNSSSSNSAGVCTQLFANTGLNKHSQDASLS